MNTRKRPASAIAGDNLQESATKQTKVEHDDTGHSGSMPENHFIPMSSTGINDAGMLDFDPTVNQQSMPSEIPDNPYGALPVGQTTLTWGVQAALGNLRILSAEEKNTVLESIIRQMAPVLPGNNTLAAVNPAIPNSINQAGMQLDKPNLHPPMSHSSELQEARERIKRQSDTIKEQDGTIKEKDNIIEKLETACKAMPQRSHQSDSELPGPKQETSFGSSSAIIDQQLGGLVLSRRPPQSR
ncbi:hypothetical protein PG988_002317 [Apiospora saccharicola]